MLNLLIKKYLFPSKNIPDLHEVQVFEVEKQVSQELSQKSHVQVKLFSIFLNFLFKINNKKRF